MGAGRRLGVPLMIAGLCATAGLGAQRASRATAINGLIVGQVVDARTGRPVSGATVWLGGTASGGVIRQTSPTRILTGTDGRFYFSSLNAGAYTVNSSKPGYLAGTAGRTAPEGPAPPIVLSAEAPVAEATIRMWRSATIGGSVVDEAGEPVVRVMVRALRKSIIGGRPLFGDAGFALTDDRGAYRIANLRPGDYVVLTSEPPRAFSRDIAREFKAHGGEGHTMLPMLQLDDYVVQLGTGAPVPPPPTNGQLRVYPQTFYPGTDAVSQAGIVSLGTGDEFLSADLALRPTAVTSVRGQVFGAELTNAPLLALIRADAEAMAPALAPVIAPAQRGGTFLFPAVAAGDYVLKVMAMTTDGGFQVSKPGDAVVWASVPITVGADPVNDLAVPLRPGLHIRGELHFSGAGQRPTGGLLQRVPIAVEPAYGGVLLSSMGDRSTITGRAAGSGSFDVGGLPGGTYIVRVTNSPQGWMFKGAYYGGRDISVEPIEMTTNLEGVVVEFTDRWTGLHGNVLGAQRPPETGTMVLVFPTDRSAWEGYGPAPRRLRSTMVNPNGTYNLDSLPPGDYYAVAVSQEDVSEWRDPNVLDALARRATRVTIRDDGKTNQDLRVR